MEQGREKKDKKEKKDKSDKKDKKSKEEKKDKKEKKEKKDKSAEAPAAKRPGEDDLDSLASLLAKRPRPGEAEAAPLAPAPAQPEQEEEQADPDAEEADFWEALGEEIRDEKPEEPEQPKVTITGESGVLQVPPEAVEELSAKIEQIATLTGASLTIRNNILRVSGSLAVRTRAERYARMLVEKRLVADVSGDVCLVHVPHEWAQGWKGEERELEASLDVLIFYEEARGARSFRLPGQIIEVNWQKKGWHLALVLGGGARAAIRVRWAYDGSTAEVQGMQVRPAQRIIVCGRARERVQAQARILSLAEQASRGVIATQLAVHSAAGGLGTEEIRMNATSGTIWKIQNAQLAGVIAKATGCVALEFYVNPKSVQTSEQDSRNRVGEQCALVAGTRDQRWLAGQIANLLAAGLENRTLKSVPNHLVGECRFIKVPKDCMGMVLGKGARNLHKLMQDTSCVVILTKEQKGKEKREANEMDDLLEMMFDNVREGPTTELAIFGAPWARMHCEVKLMVSIESKFTGFYAKPDGETEELDRSDSLGIDKLWFESDFEPDATRQRSAMLAAASSCGAEAVGKLLLLYGTGPERNRGREYCRWMVGKIAGRLPSVPNADSRRDVATLKVPRVAMKNTWLKAELIKLSLETKTWAFYDDWEGEGPEGPEGLARLVVAGTEVEKGGKFVSKLLEDAKQMVDDAVTYGRPRSSYKDEEWSGDWSKWGGGWNAWSGGWGGSWSWGGDEAGGNIPPPATPAPGGGLNGVPPPATPGVPRRGVPPPATPVPGGGSRGVPPPATPAPGGGGGGVPPPATPAPGGLIRGVPPPATPAPGRGGNVPPPATPGGPRPGLAPPATPGGFGPHGSQAPCTPAPGGFGGGLAPPATPGGFGPHGNSAPCTPAPGNFGPHGSQAPCTPAPGARLGAAPPATPGGFGPHGNAAPCTPAPGGFGGVAPPATPGMPRRGVAPPATPGVAPSSVAAPCTPAPAGFGSGVAPPATPGAPAGQRKVPAPQTPGFPGAAEPKKSVAAPQTPAFLGGGAEKKVPAPHTPAFLGGGEEKKAPPPAPQTPAFLGVAPEKKPEKRAVAAPQTPAFLGDGPTRSFGSAPPKSALVRDDEPVLPRSSQPPREAPAPKPQASGKLLTFNSLKKAQSKDSLDSVNKSPPAATSIRTEKSSPKADLPPGWTIMYSKSNGKAYYWNAKLKQSQYELPKA